MKGWGKGVEGRADFPAGATPCTSNSLGGAVGKENNEMTPKLARKRLDVRGDLVFA